ncbi:MAG: hypothetical protein BWY72_02471 [Bacteroidetes bacterium ADurb.Bin416]|nr:MAG: hypothetical protein BWY72_02471 [Bacteroidetes bacterium ADurb.Bin416]
MLDEATRLEILEAYKHGHLKAETVDPSTGAVSLQVVTDVLKHHTPHKDMVRVTMVDGRDVTCTVDHSLFRMVGDGVSPTLAGDLHPGSFIAIVEGGVAKGVEVASLVHLPPDEFTYDLSVPGPENFVLANGVLAHNTYSIGGISLDLERSSKYEQLRQSAESQVEKAGEAKLATTKFTRGLQQSRYGMGVRSAFGPAVGRGVTSPRNFLVLPLISIGYTLLHYLFSSFVA